MSTEIAGDVLSFIDAAQRESLGADWLDVVDPSSGRAFLRLPAGCAADADRAVASCRRTFDEGVWSDAPPSFRKDVLLRLADLVAAQAAVLDRLDAEEMGKPVSIAFASALGAAKLFRFYAETVDKVTGDVYPSDSRSLVIQRFVPRGVVAAIVPWNFPTYVAALKIAPALAAGNSVVLKPSEMSSRSGRRLAELAVQAGLPSGVLNVVVGRGETVGKALGLHMDVDMVTFTGSSDVGKLMLQYSGQSNMKVVTAECGGKSPQIVFADGVDLEAAANRVATLLLTNQGQICTVGSRLLVHRSIEAEMIERIRAKVREIVVGDPREPATTFGPVASARQADRVMSYVSGAASEGAQLVAGGSRLLPDSGGYFLEPTLFRNVAPSARIAREEIFGPVLAVIPFADEMEALRIANSTMYGLAAYVWTADLSTGMRVAKAIRSSVRINAAAQLGEGEGLSSTSEPYGQSGVGPEGGIAGLHTYMRRQRVGFNHT